MEISVRGTSMLPFIPPGSRVEVERLPPENVKVGDVVCYIDESAWALTHRVVNVENRADGILFRVRGDAQADCREVTSASVVYVVRRVRYGWFSYGCDEGIGQIISRITTSDAPPQKLARNALITLWEAAAQLRQLYRKFQ
jgi:hypothetical protein